MEIFLDRLFSGLTAGSIYVLIALALVVVFRSSGTINFAQGEFALFTSFVAWWLTTKGSPCGRPAGGHGRWASCSAPSPNAP